MKDLKKKACGRTKWNTKAGSFSTSQKVKCKFTLPEFFENRDLDWEMYLDESDMKCNYDMIVGRDLMDAIGLDILFSKGTMIWDNSEVPMKPYDSFENLDQYEQEVMMMHDPDTTESERIQQILDGKYTPADLKAEVAKCEMLSLSEKEDLLTLLNKYETLFDGSLGQWNTDPIKLELKLEASPYHAKP